MRLLAVLVGAAAAANAQSFLTALEAFPQASMFVDLLTTNAAAATSYLSVDPNNPKTIFVPSNTAFQRYQTQSGTSISSLSSAQLGPLISYHVLDGSYTAAAFSNPQGLTVPTLLNGDTYNNRTGGAQLGSVGGGTNVKNGQVLFIGSKDAQGPSKKRSFYVRQSTGVNFAKSGLGYNVTIDAVDGTWDGGHFQIIDGFLTLPQTCTKTMLTTGWTALDRSLNRTNLATVLDTSRNVTCLAPNNAAFAKAGNPDQSLDPAELAKAILFHTIPMPLYTNFLVNGMTFKTLSNDTVMVTITNGSIYFNDAKVVKQNVITNNGLIHALDRIMSKLNTTSNGTSTTSGTATATSAAATSKAAAAGLIPASSIEAGTAFFGLAAWILSWAL